MREDVKEIRERYRFLDAWRRPEGSEELGPEEQGWADVQTLLEAVEELESALATARFTTKGVEAIGKGVLAALETWRQRTEALREGYLAILNDYTGPGYCDHLEDRTEEMGMNPERMRVFSPKRCRDIENCIYCRMEHLATESYEDPK